MQVRDIAKLSELFRALSDPTRIKLLLALQKTAERSVSDLTKALRLPQPTVSTHLTILRLHGLVRDRRRGKFVFYSVARTQLDGLLRKVNRLLPARAGGRRRRP